MESLVTSNYLRPKPNSENEVSKNLISRYLYLHIQIFGFTWLFDVINIIISIRMNKVTQKNENGKTD